MRTIQRLGVYGDRMDRKVVPYTSQHKDACLNVFKSNIGKYFADDELKEYEEFLGAQVHSTKYFVVFSGEKVIGCGGYYLRDGEIRLVDGMIEQASHKTGAGLLLLEHRLNAAKSEYPDKSVGIATSQHTEGFFKKYGFKTTDIVKNFFGEGIDKVSMLYSP